MGEFQILSSEEVDAILKVTEEKSDLSQVLGTSEEPKSQQHNSSLSNIVELTRTECEKALSSFLRKKIVIKAKPANLAQLSVCLDEKNEKNIFSVFHLMPNDTSCLFYPDLSFLHQAINLLYGGQIESNESIMETPGKVGTIVAEKICQICLSALAQACQEYGSFTFEGLKTSALPNLMPHLNLNDQVYLLEFSIFFDELETTIKFMIPEEFLNVFIPEKMGDMKHREKDFWRTAIKSQVVDSFVTINITLPDVNMKVKDFMDLKEGDTIPISDPTLVYVCLNSIKLFRATAGQANSKMVAKITKQI